MSDHKERFSSWLRRELGQRELQQADLARMLDVSTAIASRWYNGTALPKSDNARRIAEVLGVDPDFVLDLAGHRPMSARDELADLDPEVRFYFLNYHRLPLHLQRLLKAQLRAYYEELEREQQRDGEEDGESGSSRGDDVRR